MENSSAKRGDELIERLSKKLDSNSRNSIQGDLTGLYLHPEWWAVRSIPGLSVKHFDTLRDFIIYRYPWGLGWTMRVAEAFILPELPEIWQAIQRDVPAAAKHGGKNKYNSDEVDNVNFIKGGNAQEYKIRRLKRDAPALADKVIKGEMSANAAFIKAGLGRKKITIEPTVEGYTKSIQKNLNNDQIHILKSKLP